MDIKLFDSHCHVNFKAFQNETTDVIRRSLDSGVGLNIVGTKLKTSEEALELAKKHKDVYATVGLHPVHLFEQNITEEGESFKTKPEEFDYESFKKLAQEENVIAIGEMGLDYFHIPKTSPNPLLRKEGRLRHPPLAKGRIEEGSLSLDEAKETQKKVLLEGIKLAGELGKPMVFHVRPSKDSFDAYDHLYKILLEVRSSQLPVRGVVHCFGGTLEQAKKFVELGLYIGITGIVTFKNAKELQEVVREIPLEKLLIETDAPFLAPEPYRGQRNEPSYVKHVAEKISAIKGVSFEDVAEQTTENAMNLFKLIPS